MPYTAEELLIIASNFDDIASESILKSKPVKSVLDTYNEEHPKIETIVADPQEAKCVFCKGKGYSGSLGDTCQWCEGSGIQQENEFEEDEQWINTAAKGKGKFPFWLMKKKKDKKKEKDDTNDAKDSKKKLDPSAAVRNRGTVCFPAENSKDKKDHFPINDIDQARNALSQVGKYTSAPPWYNGSLTSLKNTVSRKVHSKYPSIGKSETSKKKSSADIYVREGLLNKYAEEQPQMEIDEPNQLEIDEWLKTPEGQAWQKEQQKQKYVAPPNNPCPDRLRETPSGESYCAPPDYKGASVFDKMISKYGQALKGPAFEAATAPKAPEALKTNVDVTGPGGRKFHVDEKGVWHPKHTEAPKGSGYKKGTCPYGDATKLQQALSKYIGSTLGDTGPSHDGVDGDWGSKSEAGLEQYVRMANVGDGTPSLANKQKAAQQLLSGVAPVTKPTATATAKEEPDLVIELRKLDALLNKAAKTDTDTKLLSDWLEWIGKNDSRSKSYFDLDNYARRIQTALDAQKTKTKTV